jgi:hypothetical protein
VRRGFARALACGLVVALSTASVAAAQQLGASRSGVTARHDAEASAASAGGRQLSRLDRLPLWSAPIASLLIPGLGQARLHKDRFVGFMALETFLLLQYAKESREGAREEREYRSIARDVARRGFVTSPPDTAWQYYEKLEKYLESGAFTMVPNGPTVPETDSSTYNGSIWVLARRQFGLALNDPNPSGSARYQQALELYEGRAVRQPYRWSWRNAQLEQDLYRRTVSRTNDAYRRATIELSAIIANHLLSAVDAFVSVRLMQAEGGGMRLSAAVPVP